MVSVLNLRRLFSSVTVLEGNAVTLSCTPSITEAVLVWTHNGTNVEQRNDITYSPPILNHSLIIANARIRDSGVYTCQSCHAADTLDEQNITVEVIAGSRVNLLSLHCVLHLRLL